MNLICDEWSLFFHKIDIYVIVLLSARLHFGGSFDITEGALMLSENLFVYSNGKRLQTANQCD